MSVKLINQIDMQKSHGFPPMCIIYVTFASITFESLLQCFHLFFCRDPTSTFPPCSSEPSYTSHGSTLAKGNRPQSINFWNCNNLLEKIQLRLLLIPPNHTQRNHMKSKNEILGKKMFFFKSIVAPFQIRSSHRFRAEKKYCIPLSLNFLMIPKRKQLKKHLHKRPWRTRTIHGWYAFFSIYGS